MSNLPLVADIVQQHTICNTRDRQAIRSKLLVRLHCQTMRSSTGKCQALVQNRQTLQAKIVDGGFCSLDLRTYYTIIILPISRYTMLNESNSKIEKCSENKTPAFSQQLCRSCCLRRVCLPFSNVRPTYRTSYTIHRHITMRTEQITRWKWSEKDMNVCISDSFQHTRFASEFVPEAAGACITLLRIICMLYVMYAPRVCHFIHGHRTQPTQPKKTHIFCEAKLQDKTITFLVLLNKHSHT